MKRRDARQKRLAARIVATALILMSLGLLIGTNLWYIVWHPELTIAEMLRATWYVLILGAVVFWIGMYVGDRAR